MDVTPNIEVSLIVQPGNTRYLAPSNPASLIYRAEMGVARWLARPYFWMKMRPKKITASEILTAPDGVAKARDAGIKDSAA